MHLWCNWDQPSPSRTRPSQRVKPKQLTGQQLQVTFSLQVTKHFHKTLKAKTYSRKRKATLTQQRGLRQAPPLLPPGHLFQVNPAEQPCQKGGQQHKYNIQNVVRRYWTPPYNVPDIEHVRRVLGSFLGGIRNERGTKKAIEIGKTKHMQHRILHSLEKDTWR